MSESTGSDGSNPPGPGSYPTPPRHPDHQEPTQFRPQFQPPSAGSGPQHSSAQQPYWQQPYSQQSYSQQSYPQQPYPRQPQQPYGYPSVGPAVPPRTPASRKRNGGVLVMAAVLAILLGGGAGYLGARLGQNQSGPTSAPPVATRSTGPGAGRPTGVQPSAGPAGQTKGRATPNSTGNASSDATPIPPTRGSADTVKIARRMLPSTVTIEVTVGAGGDLGSGFVLDNQGRIMTNNHVVADAANGGSIMVSFSDGHRSRAKILGRSPSYDLAVIQVADHANLHPADLGDSSRTKVGEAAVAIGSPLGLGGTVTEGIVSAVNRPVAVGDANSTDGQAYLNAIQTDAPINHGNSGGPLVNGEGEVIGVDSAILTGSSSNDQQDSGNIGIGFAIPINQAEQTAALLIKDGHATYPVIGATVTGDGSGNGVTLSAVTPDGAADQAGLRANDVITAIDGQRVNEPEDLIVAIRTHRPGDVVTLNYERNGNSASVQVRLGGKRG